MSFAFVVCLWSCWNYGYELDIVATTRSNRVRQSFSFVSFSLSIEFLEDKQAFKLGGVDTSPSYLLFRTLLPLFWTLICMIWMELTRTNAIFSRIAMVFDVSCASLAMVPEILLLPQKDLRQWRRKLSCRRHQESFCFGYAGKFLSFPAWPNDHPQD